MARRQLEPERVARVRRRLQGRWRKARVSPDGNRRYTESVSTTPNFVPNESELVFCSDNTFTLRRDALFRSEPSYLLRGALGTPMNVHLGECPRFDSFTASTCYDAMKDRADLVEKKTGRKESHAFFDTFMDVSEVKGADGSWHSDLRNRITDEYIDWTAREIVAYATFLRATRIVYKPYGQVAFDNLHRIIAAVTRILNEGV